MTDERIDHIASLKSPRRSKTKTARADDAAEQERQRIVQALTNEARHLRQRTGDPPIEDEIDTHEEILSTITDLPDPTDDGIYLGYLLERFDLEAIGEWVVAGFRSGELELDLKLPELRPKRELPVTVDSHKLSQARWGMVCHPDDVEMLRFQLAPLLEKRKRDQKKKVDFFVVGEKETETASMFLGDKDHAEGVVDPEKLPYYLLIASHPDKIPFDFQYQLGVDRAVGRIAFDSPDDYGRYARAVVEAEEGGAVAAPRATVFSVENEDDDIAPALAKYLSLPLADRLKGFPGWKAKLFRADQATKESLQRLLAAETEAPPGLLLVSSHGASVSKALKDGLVQQLLQGALICQQQDGDGDRLFSAFDVPEGAKLTGQIAFLFACYGGGTPILDNFPTYRMAKGESERPDPRRSLTDRAFVAKLPQKLLSHGTLATVAHIDRGWLLSFVWTVGNRAISSTASLEDTLLRLLMGERLGHAFRPLQRRAASISFRLNQVLEHVRDGLAVDPTYLGQLWLTASDARNLVILGDPAVYLLGQKSSGALLRLPKELTTDLRNQALAHGYTLEDWALAVLREKVKKDD